MADASNLLFTLQFAKIMAITNCAYPGDKLSHIASALRDPYFDRLLRRPNLASY